jgi:hypothetical protein
MKNRNFFSLALTTIVLSNIAYSKGNRFEAEQMKLTHYQVGSIENTTFTKLTGSTAVATFIFNLPSGKYDIDARYLSEKIGQNTYAMYLNDVQIISWLGKNRDDQRHMVSEQKWHAPKNIAINNGGRHPIGKVGINQTIDSFSVSGFDDLQSDKSLSYDKVVK